MSDSFVRPLWDIETDLMGDDTTRLTPQRKRELKRIFRMEGGKPSFTLLTYLVQCDGGTTKENLERWQECFDEHCKRVDGWLSAPPDFPSKDWGSWMYHMELIIFELAEIPSLEADEIPSETNRPDWMQYQHEEDETASWIKYASKWRSLPTEDMASRLFEYLLPLKHKLKYESIDWVKKHAPQTPVEQAYADGLMDSCAHDEVEKLKDSINRDFAKNILSSADMRHKMEEIVAEKQLREKETMRADNAEKMHDQLASRIGPLIEGGLMEMADKVWQHKKPKRGRKKEDADAATILREEKIYCHFETDRRVDGNLSFEQFAKDTVGNYGLNKKQMENLSDRAQKRRKNGVLDAAKSRCRGKK
jgi:hypothetical protein